MQRSEIRVPGLRFSLHPGYGCSEAGSKGRGEASAKHAIEIFVSAPHSSHLASRSTSRHFFRYEETELRAIDCAASAMKLEKKIVE